MAKQVAPDTTYVVRLGVLTNSFYDPESKANLFKNTPYYFFNHKPTKAILNGVANGRLVDLKGNIVEEENGSVTRTSDDSLQKEVAELKAQVASLKKENQELRADIITYEDKVAEAEEKLEQALKSEKKTTEKKVTEKKTSEKKESEQE